MDQIPKELVWLRDAGFRVEEWSEEVYLQAPSERSAVYLLAEKKPGGYSYGLTYRAGLSSEQLESLSEEVRTRILSLVTDGPDGPFNWDKGVAVPGFYTWIALHDLDPWLGS